MDEGGIWAKSQLIWSHLFETIIMEKFSGIEEVDARLRALRDFQEVFGAFNNVEDPCNEDKEEELE